jgi:hypothetical protein
MRRLQISGLLSIISTSTLEMLNDRSIKSFDFAFREAALMFPGRRAVDDHLLLTAAAVASGDLRAFYQKHCRVARPAAGAAADCPAESG